MMGFFCCFATASVGALDVGLVVGTWTLEGLGRALACVDGPGFFAGVRSDFLNVFGALVTGSRFSRDGVFLADFTVDLTGDLTGNSC